MTWRERSLLVLRRPAGVRASARDDASRSERLLVVARPGRDVLGTTSACPRRPDRRLNARGRVCLGRFVRARRLFPARVSRVRGCARRGPTCRSSAHGRSWGSRSCRSRCRCSCGSADRGLRRRPVRTGGSDTGLGPPRRGGRGRGARVIGRPAVVGWCLLRLVDRPRVAAAAPALALAALAVCGAFL